MLSGTSFLPQPILASTIKLTRAPSRLRRSVKAVRRIHLRSKCSKRSEKRRKLVPAREVVMALEALSHPRQLLPHQHPKRRFQPRRICNLQRVDSLPVPVKSLLLLWIWQNASRLRDAPERLLLLPHLPTTRRRDLSPAPKVSSALPTAVPKPQKPGPKKGTAAPKKQQDKKSLPKVKNDGTSCQMRTRYQTVICSRVQLPALSCLLTWTTQALHLTRVILTRPLVLRMVLLPMTKAMMEVNTASAVDLTIIG